jgi:hypothetical protein
MSRSDSNNHLSKSAALEVPKRRESFTESVYAVDDGPQLKFAEGLVHLFKSTTGASASDAANDYFLAEQGNDLNRRCGSFKESNNQDLSSYFHGFYGSRETVAANDFENMIHSLLRS